MTNPNSILESTKKVLGLDADYTAFDHDIQMHINTAFSNLHQLGIGPIDGFEIEDDSAEWNDFLGDGNLPLNSVRSYIYLTVRLMFDPPASAYGTAAMERQIDELVWRINVRREEEAFPYAPPSVSTTLLGEELIL